VLQVSSHSINAHKCILVSRSDKFKSLLRNKEEEEQKRQVGNSKEELILECQNLNLFRNMLTWMYTSDIDLTGVGIGEVVELYKLTQEYLLSDLAKICEDDIIEKLDSSNIVGILTDQSLSLEIRDAATNVLVSDYKTIMESHPDVEDILYSIEGLVS
jgi:hypothetical protein